MSVSDEPDVEEIVRYISSNEGADVLFVFDGYDKKTEERRQKSIISEVMADRFTPLSSFVVTTRPISAERLYHCVDRRVEICGFRDEEVKEYITKYFASSKSSAGEKLLSALVTRPSIKNQDRFGTTTCMWHTLHLTVQEYMAGHAVAKKSPEKQVEFWRNHLKPRYDKEGRFVLTEDHYKTAFLFYCGVSGLSKPGIQRMLLDTLGTAVGPAIHAYTPLAELCEAASENKNVEFAHSIYTICMWHHSACVGALPPRCWLGCSSVLPTGDLIPSFV